MGVYNKIFVNCPNCGELVEFQSKSGSCMLESFHIKSVPENEVQGILGDTRVCECGKKVTIMDIKSRRKDFSFLIEREVPQEYL